MAVTRTLSNHFKTELGKGTIDFSDATAGAFRVILMTTAYAFDPDTHDTYLDIKASEITTAGGYEKLTKPLVASAAWAQDNVNDKAAIVWENVTWTASAANFDAIGAAVILQYDAGGTATGDNSIVVGCIDFGEDITVADGISFQLQNMGFNLRQAA